jgi:dihydrofolate reductase
MKIILLFAASLNGYIAEADHSVDWPAEVWQAYSKISKEI